MLMVVIVLLGLLVVAAAATLAPRLGLPAPLLLVAVGIVVSFLPVVPALDIEPEWVLAGVLPPLLYSASVSMPTMSLRRDLGAISGLSVVLVVLTSLVLGVVLSLLLPDLSFAWAVALGAILSPTDAVATGIVRRAGVPPRTVALLEGEGLLNDASALVVLKVAVAATAAAFSFWDAVGTFLWAVASAALIGWLVGRGNLLVRARVTDPTVNTVLSFAVPFLASIPTEVIGGSGLVAAVVAGLITGRRGPRLLAPEHRLSDQQSWRTAELLLEGVVFATMGLQLYGLIEEVHTEHAGIPAALGIAAVALAVTLVVRAGFVAPLLVWLRRKAARGQAVAEHIRAIKDRMSDPAWAAQVAARRGGPGAAGSSRGPSRSRIVAEQHGSPSSIGSDGPASLRGTVGRSSAPPSPFAAPGWTGPARPGGGGPPGGGGRGGRRRAPGREDLARFATRVRRMLADIEYFTRSPLDQRDGLVVVWSGMRGAVTVAAAQTLPADTPDRALLVLVAFAVAAMSLLVQGGTVGPLARRLYAGRPPQQDETAEHTRLLDLMVRAGDAVPMPEDDGTPAGSARVQAAELDRVRARRVALLDARDDGTFDAEQLTSALAVLDAEEISLTMKGAGAV